MKELQYDPFRNWVIKKVITQNISRVENCSEVQIRKKQSNKSITFQNTHPRKVRLRME